VITISPSASAFPGLTDALRRLELGDGSQINVPIAVLRWLMVYPMMRRSSRGPTRRLRSNLIDGIKEMRVELRPA